MNVYELTQEFERVVELIDTIEEMKAAGESEGLEQFETQTHDYYDSLNMSLQDKLDAMGRVLCNLESEKAAKKAEAARLTERAKAIENRISYIKDQMIKPALLAAGGGKVQGDLFTMSLRKSTAVEVVDSEALPKEFVKIKTTTSPDKTAIKKALADGKEVPGAKLQENKSVQIR